MTDDWSSVEIEGMDEFEARLADLSNAAAGKSLFGALNFALTPVVKDAKSLAPVADEQHTMTLKGGKKVEVNPGLLKDSIKKVRLPKGEHKGDFSQGAVMGVRIAKDRKQKLYPNYWHIKEYGSSNQPATPFLRPSFDKNIETMIDRFGTKLNKNIEKYTED